MDFSFDVPAYWPDMSYPSARLYADLLETVKTAEEIGMKSITIPEHHFINYFAMPAPLVLASHLAAITKKVRIIAGVIVLPFHDVRVLAGEINVADHLCNGRLELGFGRGGAKYEFTCMGLPHENARQVFDEKFEVLMKLLVEKNVTWKGEFVNIPELTIVPPPMQKPRQPVWIAALRPEAAYHLAKRGINVQASTLREPVSKAKELIRAFHEGARECTEKVKPRISFFRWVFVTGSREEEERILRLGVENEERFHNLFVTDGFVNGGEVQRVPTEHTPQSVKAVAIIGSAEECIEKLKQYEELGVDDLNIRMNFGPDHASVMKSLERFERDVLPSFHRADSGQRSAARA